MARQRNPIDDDRALAAFIHRKAYQAQNDEDGDVSDVRQQMFNYYYGKPYGNEREGYSQFVTREVLEAIEWALPSIAEPLLAGDVVEFTPFDAKDEPIAEQETAVVRHKLFGSAEGWTAGTLWIKDALMAPTAYARVRMKPVPRRIVSEYTGLTRDEIDSILGEDVGGDVELDVLEMSEPRITSVPLGGDDPATAAAGYAPFPVYDVTIERIEETRKLVFEILPPEEVLVDRDATTTSLDETMVIYRTRKTYSQLRMMGYSESELEDTAAGMEDHRWNDETVNRRFYEDEDPDQEDEEADPSLRTYTFHEIWLNIDWDDDGIAERRRVVMVGNKILENEPEELTEIVAMSTMQTPHRHQGLSLAETVQDIQLLSSTLTRQMLDNIYAVNIARTVVNNQMLAYDGSTMDQLMSRDSEFVKVEGPPGQAIMKEETSPIIDQIRSVLEGVHARKRIRTGVAPETALDPEVLQKSTAQGFDMAMTQSSQRLKLILRTMAETGFRPLFIKARMLLQRYQDKAETIRLRGEYVSINPSRWRDRMDADVNVGLGQNTPSQDVQMIMQLLGIQREAMQAGLAGPREIYNALDKLTKGLNVGPTQKFFMDPNQEGWQPPPQQEDPAMVLAKAEQQKVQVQAVTEAEKLKLEAQVKAKDAELTMARVQLEQMKGEFERQKAEMDQRERGARLLMDASKEDREARLESAKLAAEVRNTDADSVLKEAQTVKALADAGQSSAAAGKLEIEASDEYRDAQEILEDGVETPTNGQAGPAEPA